MITPISKIVLESLLSSDRQIGMSIYDCENTSEANEIIDEIESKIFAWAQIDDGPLWDKLGLSYDISVVAMKLESGIKNNFDAHQEDFIRTERNSAEVHIAMRISRKGRAGRIYAAMINISGISMIKMARLIKKSGELVETKSTSEIGNDDLASLANKATESAWAYFVSPEQISNGTAGIRLATMNITSEYADMRIDNMCRIIMRNCLVLGPGSSGFDDGVNFPISECFGSSKADAEEEVRKICKKLNIDPNPYLISLSI